MKYVVEYGEFRVVCPNIEGAMKVADSMEPLNAEKVHIYPEEPIEDEEELRDKYFLYYTPRAQR